jgi:hypothetical protein
LAALAERASLYQFSRPAIVRKYKSRLDGMSNEAGACSCRVKKLPGRLKTPEISQTPPLGQRKNHEKYSAGASAAMRYSWKATRIISA